MSIQTNELELLTQRIREAEERLRRVEEENEESSVGRPTPPVSPDKPLPSIGMNSNLGAEDEDSMAEIMQHSSREDEV